MRAPPRALAILLLTLPLIYAVEVGTRWQTLELPMGPGAEPVLYYAHLDGDCIWYRTTIVSLLADGDLDQRNNVPMMHPRSGPRPVFPPESDVALGANGAWYPKHPLLLSLLGLPFYALAGDLGLLAFNLVQLTALLVVAWFLVRRYTSEVVALATTWWLALASQLSPAAYNFSPDVLSTLLVVSGVLALVSRRAAFAGALFGLACCARWSNAILLPIASLFVLHEFERRDWLAFVAPLAACLLALAALNAWMFGSVFVTPYDRVIGSFKSGVPVLEASHRELFDAPFFSGLWAQLTDRDVGLVVSGPHVLVAVFGLVLLWRRSRADTLLLVGICLALLAFFAPYEPWRASSIGHRFLMTVVVLSALPAALLFARVATRPPPRPSAPAGS
ncbi:MAG: glycosyltransferase 87 family protein [Myxococcota bacterium]